VNLKVIFVKVCERFD